MEESSPLYKLYMDTAYVRENPPPKKFAEHKVQYLHFWYLKELSNTKPTIWEMILEIEISRVEGGEYLENGYQKVDVVFCVFGTHVCQGWPSNLEDSLVACFLGPLKVSHLPFRSTSHRQAGSKCCNKAFTSDEQHCSRLSGRLMMGVLFELFGIWAKMKHVNRYCIILKKHKDENMYIYINIKKNKLHM